MNLQSFKKRVKASGIVMVINANDKVQWLSDGRNMYALSTLQVNEGAIPELLDFNAKELSQIRVTETSVVTEYISIYPTMEEEELNFRAVIRMDERQLMVFEFFGRALFVDAENIKPMGGEDPARYTVRLNNGQVACVAAYRDSMAAALIKPEHDTQDLLNKIRELGELKAYE